MSKGGRGRPRREDGESTTRQIRVFEDLADMISWLIEVEGGSVANLVDPLLRPQIVMRYEKIKDAVAQIKAVRDQARKGEE